MSKILIADDHAMVRAGLRQFLTEDRSITEIGEAASGNETLDKLRSGSWDLVILDINMPDRSGLDILRYLPKECAPEELLKATRAVMQGRRYVSANLAELLLSDLNGDNDQPLHRRLSEREFQIFCKLASGRAVSSIADELCLSVKTVSTYRTRILEKMNLATNADITTYALRNGIIQ